jgi:hypothetical protein
MATNRDLLKEAIADAKAVKHMAIANAKAALEEAFTPQVNALFSAKLREMEELEEDIHEASETEEEEKAEHLEEVEEEEEEESMEEEAPEEEESEEGETKIEDMTEEDLAKLIEDIMLEEFPELAKMRGEEAEETPEEEGGEEEGGEEMDMDMDLAELLREIEDEPLEESEVNLDELLAEIAEEDEAGMVDEEYEMEKEKHMKSKMMETELRSELAEAYTAIDVLRSELTEINMLNAKLLYTNKIFKSKNLSESQKVKVLSSFDKAVTVKEVKLVYETLNEGLKVKTAPTNNNVGRASKTTLSPTVKKPIIESNEAFARMQKLAGLI